MVDKTVENCSIIFKIKLDLDIIIKSLYTRFRSVSVANNWNLSMSDRHYCIKNYFLLAKIEVSLDTYIVNLYTKCHKNMSNVCEENKRKLQIFVFFATSKGHNSVKKKPRS